MATSYNGWTAPPPSGIRPLEVDGASFAPGVRDDDDVWTVLAYAAEQWDQRVEWLRPGWCWGYSYRQTTGGTSLSNHASATAIDANAPLHPYGVPASRNFTPAQIATLNHIVDVELEGVLRGGWTYSTPDAMHIEVNDDAAAVRRVAEKIRSGMMDENDVKKIVQTAIAEGLAPVKAAERRRWEAEKKRDKEQAARDRANGKLLRAIAARHDDAELAQVGRSLEDDATDRERVLAERETPPEH